MQKMYDSTAKKYLALWFFSSLAIFVGLIITDVILMVLLNGRLVNKLFFPVTEYVSIFPLIWNNNPFTALYIFNTKSVLAFAHYDQRSALNLWTLEFTSISLFVYALVSTYAGWVVKTWMSIKSMPHTIIYLSGLGSGLILLSATYGTVLAHCAGATWIVYVGLLGLGFEDIPVTSLWQWLLAGMGGGLILVSLLRYRKARR